MRKIILFVAVVALNILISCQSDDGRNADENKGTAGETGNTSNNPSAGDTMNSGYSIAPDSTEK